MPSPTPQPNRSLSSAEPQTALPLHHSTAHLPDFSADTLRALSEALKRNPALTTVRAPIESLPAAGGSTLPISPTLQLELLISAVDRQAIMRGGHLVRSSEATSHRERVPEDEVLGDYRLISGRSILNALFQELQHRGAVVLRDPRTISESPKVSCEVVSLPFGHIPSGKELGRALTESNAEALRLEWVNLSSMSELKGSQAPAHQRLSHEALSRAATLLPAEDTRLINTDVQGAPRYELPATRVGALDGYEVFLRKAPARIVHWVEGKEYHPGVDEFVLVPHDQPHVVSVSVDAQGMPVESYVNLNYRPVFSSGKVTWQDLELDLKLVAEQDHWEGCVLDYDAFMSGNFSDEERELARTEAIRMLDRAHARAFPFIHPRDLRNQLSELLG